MDLILRYIDEIAIGLIVTAITSLIVIIFRNRNEIHLKQTYTILCRLKKIGITYFHYNRKTLQDDLQTIGRFISQATNEVYYIGCWLSVSILSQDLSRRLYDMASKDIKIYICIMSPNNSHIDALADFFSEETGTLCLKLYQILSMLIDIKESLPRDKQDNLSIFIHDSLISTSFWALDPHIEKKSVFQVDHKSIHGQRYSSYGFVYRRTREKEFADDLWKSYSSVLRAAKEIASSIELSHYKEQCVYLRKQ
jgi:hypothetical protein